MRRVSSQATTSASRSADSTRSVTSSRLPIGVGQTTSRPLTPGLGDVIEGEQGGAHHPRLVAEVGGADRDPARTGGMRALGDDLAGGLEQQLAGR